MYGLLVAAAGGGEKAARDPGYEGTSHSEGALSLREVGPSSGPPCWASGQFTFQTEDHLTVVWSGDWGGAGPTVEGIPGVHLCKGLPVMSRKEERPFLPDIEEKNHTRKHAHESVCERSKGRHMTTACEHLLCLFVWFSVGQAGGTQGLGLLFYAPSPSLGILGRCSPAEGHLQTFFFFF